MKFAHPARRFIETRHQIPHTTRDIFIASDMWELL